MSTALAPFIGARMAICSPWVSGSLLSPRVRLSEGLPMISLRSSGTACVHSRLPSLRSPPGCRPAAFICSTT